MYKLLLVQQSIFHFFDILIGSGTDATNVAIASSALDSASAGIATIAGSILSGQNAPASARDQVGTGLKTALSALKNVTGVYNNVSNRANDK